MPEPQELQDWVRETGTFKLAAKSCLLIEVSYGATGALHMPLSALKKSDHEPSDPETARGLGLSGNEGR